jgi:ubiquinone/menaquinone biosynthesis C-methylase UbiE
MTDTPGVREDRDLFRLAPAADTTTIETIISRLEFRRTDDRYIQFSQAYFDQLPLDTARSVLALGCGTGVEVRALRRRTAADIVGVDHSPALIAAAEHLTANEGLAEGVRYLVSDAHRLDLADDNFDVVLLHTLLSHVDDPLQVLREVRRVVRPGGTVAVFDGDYASLTFAYPDPERARLIEEMLLRAVVANPRVMRDLPRLLREAGLELLSGSGILYADIGRGSFFFNITESFGAVLARSGLLPADEVEAWRGYQRSAVEQNIFFGSTGYYTYLARRGGAEA